LLIAIIAAFALFGPIIATHSPTASNFDGGMSPEYLPRGPSARFWLGTDHLFRDEFSRLAHGARLSLAIGLCASALATSLGTAVGLVAGWHAPGRIDTVLMRAADVGLAFPFVLLVMALSAALERTTPATMVFTLGLTAWPGTARLVRSKTVQLRSLDFVEAAKALGQRGRKIIAYHIFPNLRWPLLMIASTTISHMILAESVLSYLGGGIAPPTPTWGRMLSDGQDYIAAAPWLTLAPGGAIVITVAAFNFFSEGLRSALEASRR